MEKLARRLGASPEQLRSPCSHTFKTRVIHCESSWHFLSLDSSAENESEDFTGLCAVATSQLSSVQKSLFKIPLEQQGREVPAETPQNEWSPLPRKHS